MNIKLKKNLRTLPAVLATALPPLLCGCGDGADGARAQTPEADSALQAILGAVAASPAPPPTSPRLSAQEQAVRPLDVAQMGYNEGPASALVKVTEFSDFGCGYCRQFHEEIYPTLKEIYMDGGYIEWKFVPFVLGMFPNGLQAATAAECAGEQDKFVPMRRRLFADQPRWKGSADPYPLLAELAADEGLDVGRFNLCIEAGWRDNRLRSNIRLGQEAGVQGTPTFNIDGRPLDGAVPIGAFRDILDLALTRRGVTPPPR